MSERRGGKQRALGFLKQLATAARAGLDEARERLAEQRAADAERTRAEREATAAELAAQVAGTSAEETFAVALGAPYRETFLGELAAAAEQSRPPAYLFFCGLPLEEVESVVKLLRRDFDVADTASVTAAVADDVQRLRDGEREGPEVAVLIARACWLATAAAGTGLLRRERALELTEPVLRRAAQTYSSWSDFGHAVLAGERLSPDSNALGRRALARTVDALLTTPGSPWLDHPWPGGTDA